MSKIVVTESVPLTSKSMVIEIAEVARRLVVEFVAFLQPYGL